MFSTRIFSLLFSGAAVVFLAGCITDNGGSSHASHSSPRIAKGVSIDSIQGAKTAVLVGSILYVANRDSAATGIVAVDIAADTVVDFFPETLAPNDMVLVDDSLLVISETNYMEGSLSLLNVHSGKLDTSYKSIDNDNALSGDGTHVFLLEKTLGVVTGFTGGKLQSDKVFLNVQTGSGSNPYQVAISEGGKEAFITRYNLASLLVAKTTSLDGGKLDSIDLADFVADSLQGTAGAVPNMDGIVRYGSDLFVTVQRMTGWVAKDTSKIVVIDNNSQQVQGNIPLQFKNPVAISASDKFLYVTCIDDYGVFTGGVEKIDMENKVSLGTVVTEASLGGDAYNFIPVSDTKGYVVYGATFPTMKIKAVTIP